MKVNIADDLRQVRLAVGCCCFRSPRTATTHGRMPCPRAVDPGVTLGADFRFDPRTNFTLRVRVGNSGAIRTAIPHGDLQRWGAPGCSVLLWCGLGAAMGCSWA